jgi:hypothetical protein
MRIQVVGLSLAALCLIAIPLRAQETAVKCKDGTISPKGGAGACSNHGGVDPSATKAVKKDVKAQEAQAHGMVAKTGAVVDQICADGSTSVAQGKDACSKHGGVRTATAVKTHLPAATPSGMAAASTWNDDPTGAVAKCKDGKYSHAKARKGACMKHGGIGQWM